MKFCPVVPEICRGQVHGARKERRIKIRIRIIIIIRNGAKTISLPNKVCYLIINNHHKILLSKLVFIFVKFEGVSDCCLTSIASEQFFSYIIFR